MGKQCSSQKPYMMMVIMMVVDDGDEDDDDLLAILLLLKFQLVLDTNLCVRETPKPPKTV